MTGERRKIAAIVFDLDDTLFPERQYVRSGYAAVAEALRRRVGGSEPFEQWLWGRFLAGKAGASIEALNKHFHLMLNQEQIDELINVYREHNPDIRPYDGVPEFLGRLHEHHALGLLTDGYLPAQRLKFQALKLERFFDACVFTEEMVREAWKPSTAGFESIRKKLNQPNDACAYVADNPCKDFVAPNQLGWRTVQFLRPGQVHAEKPCAPGGEPQHRIRQIDDLRDALRS